MDNAKIIEKRVQNTRKRLFPESLHSVLDKISTNEHKLFPPIYMPLVQSCNDNDTIYNVLSDPHQYKTLKKAAVSNRKFRTYIFNLELFNLQSWKKYMETIC